MTFYAFGLNHHTAPVEVREAFALDEAAQRRLYGRLRLSPAAEAVVVSTCNRTEAYLFGTFSDVAAIEAALGEHAGLGWPSAHAFRLDDEAAVLHVLRVTAGTRSQVLGDAQILKQVKDAYQLAVSEERVGPVLHRLMHTAFRTAKRVRTETALGSGAASISGLAVQAARRHFGGLAGRRVLLLGAGEMGVAALRALGDDQAQIAIANRSRARAEDVAEAFGARVIAWEDRHAAASDADVVIVTSGAPEPILHAAALPARPDAPALVLDVAMPRNVEPAVGQLAGYTLLDLGTLEAEREETTAARRAALPSAEAICQEGLAEFVTWAFNHEALRPAIQALRDTFEAIRQEEIARHAHRFESVDHEELDRLTRSIMQKLLAVPVVRLKNTDPDSLDFVRGVRFLSHVFARPGCDDAGPEEAAIPREGVCPLGHAGGETPEEAREARYAR